MNKVLNINLGGYPIAIDDDAYEYLKGYLDNIRVRFHESEGREEIMRDIEMRLGELLSAELGSRRIIMLPDVEEVVRVMGKPEDYGGEPDTHRTGAGAGPKAGPKSTTAKDGMFGIKPGRRLFRDPEDKVAAGVCSGVAAYLGVEDPVWVRLAFVVLTFASAGFWVPAYLIAWALIPEAKTAADRLSMRGEPINVDNIAREIETGFGKLESQMDAVGKEAKQQGRETAGQLNEALAIFVGAIGKAFAWVVRFFGRFGIVLLVLVLIALGFSLITTWIAGIFTFFAALPFLAFVSPHSASLNILGALNLFMLVTLPIIGMFMGISGILFKRKAPGWIGISMTVLWFINLFSLVSIGGAALNSYSQEGSFTKTFELDALTSDTLNVVSENADFNIEFNKRRIHWSGNTDETKDVIRFPNQLEIRVRKSKDGVFRVLQTVTARGATYANAMENAENAAFPLDLQGNVLFVPQSLDLKKGQVWRNQRFKLIIEMPEGKSIVFDEHIYREAAAEMSDYAPNNSQYISNNPGKRFTMTTEGLVCIDCPQWGDRDYSNYENYEHFIIQGNLEAEIRKGERFSYEIDPRFKQDVKIIHTGQRVTFDAGDRPKPVSVTIHTPMFTSLLAEGNGRIVLRGFDEGRASITAKGEPVIKAYMDCANLDINLQGPCRLELNGKGESLNANLGGGALLDAFGWKVGGAEVSLSGSSTANLFVDQEHANIKKDESSAVHLQGR
ncbi:MAG: PspC domain-containing protein [Saprospiraceae bacterium]|nr:PspC domain-containing protein [Saprospiraceae bacterium]